VAPELRQALFEWFVDVRGSLKCRLPKKLFVAKCKELFQKWKEAQTEPLPEKNELKFG